MTQAKKNAMFIFFMVFLFYSVSFASSINYAYLNQGTQVIWVSSQLVPGEPTYAGHLINGGLGDGQNNLIRDEKVAWLNNGATEFFFAYGDADQKIRIDLGQNRTVDQIGAHFSPYPGDREVWDFFAIYTSLDNVNYTLWGMVGTANDGIADIVTAPIYINKGSYQQVRYIEYQFGRYSLDYVAGGSRIYQLYAENTTIPEPTTWIMVLFAMTCFFKMGNQFKREK